MSNCLKHRFIIVRLILKQINIMYLDVEIRIAFLIVDKIQNLIWNNSYTIVLYEKHVKWLFHDVMLNNNF